ncbi:MAG: MinD/ParA family protein [Turicibacter sp.]|nr:MinD/ParA family protein [Turicibacter sp.]
MDQAEKLRTLLNKKNTPKKSESMRVISVTSGKGGVGKTNFALNLAIFMARSNKRVVVIDADFGLANIEVLLGVRPEYSFKEVLSRQVTIAEALTLGPEGVNFLSGGSGLTQLADISESQMSVLLEGLHQLEEMTDILIIDTGAGISKAVTNFLKASHEIIVVTTSDPTAIADAYTIMKVISEDNPEPPQLKVVINRIDSQKEGEEVFSRLYKVCDRFLNISPLNLGNILYDKNLIRAVKAQEPVALLYPHTESSRNIETISKTLLNQPLPQRTALKNFVDRWLSFMRD